MDILVGRSHKAIFSQPGPPQSHGWNQVSVSSMALVLRTSSSMRESEGQAVSDMFREEAGVRVGRTGLCLLARP